MSCSLDAGLYRALLLLYVCHPRRDKSCQPLIETRHERVFAT
jgi:hypothetical protein